MILSLCKYIRGYYGMSKSLGNKKSDKLLMIMGSLMLISFITFWVYAFKDSYNYDESMRNALLVVVSAIVFVVSFIVFGVLSGKAIKGERGGWLDTAFRDNNIKNEDIKFT